MMRAILKNPTRDAIIAAMEANWCANRRAWGAVPGICVRDDATFFWFATGVANTWLNCVMRAQLTEANAEAGIATACAYFARRDTPHSWIIGPTTTPADLSQRLTEQGYTPAHPARWMALTLPDPLIIPTAPAGVTILPVTDAATYAQWEQVIIADTAGDDAFSARIRQVQFATSQQEGRQHFVALLGNAPVAISTVLLAAGVAGIYGVVTLPQAQRQGIGTAITQAALAHAQQAGYHLAVLQTSRMGLSVYQRLGFALFHDFPIFDAPAIPSDHAPHP